MARDHTALVRRLQGALDQSSSRATKAWWERYLRGAIGFRGIGIPGIRSALSAWRADSGLASWPLADQFALALRLFEEPLAEDKLAGILFLQEHLYDRVPWPEALRRYGTLFERQLIADWNTCDWFCVRVLGPTIAARGMACATALSRWSRSPLLWKARASVVAFVPVTAAFEYHPLVLRSCAVLIRRNERFAKTAVGWILRELSKHDARAVTAFVDDQLPCFSTESLRNALKYLPEATQRRFLKGPKRVEHQHAPARAGRRR